MRARLIRAAAGVVIAAALATSAYRAAGGGGGFPLRMDAARLFADTRPLEVRVGDAHRWVPCTRAGERGPGPLTLCDGGVVPPSTLTAATALARRARDVPSTSSDAIWTIAVIDLVTASARPEILERSIAALTTVAARDTSNAAALNDLAVARLVLALARDDVASRFSALDALERASRLDTTSAVIAFNRALALDELHLFEEAEAAWASLQAHRDGGAWSAEARRRAAALRAVRAAPRFGDLVARDAITSPAGSNLNELAIEDPQGAREYVLDVLVSAWGQAARRDDAARARSALAMMRTIGAAIAAATGDSSVAHVAHACDAADAAVNVAAVDFGTGAASFRSGNFDAAQAPLDRALATLRSADAAPLAAWAELLRAAIDLYRGDFIAADARYARIEAGARRRHEAALEARAQWGLALSAARRGRMAEAVGRYSAAQQIFERIGERANEGSMHSQRADLLWVLGRDDAALLAHRDALRALEERPAPGVRHGVLLALGRLLGDVGMPHAAIAVFREAVRSAAATARPKDHPEAMIRLAAAEGAAGHAADGQATLARTHESLGSITDALMRDRLTMEAASAEAALLESSMPQMALVRLIEVEAFYRRRGGDFGLPPTLVRRARLRLRMADTTGARRDLGGAIAAVEAMAVSAKTPADARAIAAARRDVYRELVALSVAAADTAAAMELAERARWPATAGHRVGVPVAAGVVRLAYTLLRDETIVWVATDAGARMVRASVGAGRLNALVERLEMLVRRDADPAALQATARELHALLMEPAARELARAREVEIVTDGVLDRLPFALLRDETGRFLVESITIRYASGAATAGAAAAGAPPLRASGALIVGDPAFDRSTFPDLDELRGAAHEAAEVGANHTERTLLLASAATKGAVLRALPRASLLHFAGHARLVERAPEFSHLVLAGDPDAPEGSTLTAEEISRLDLRRLHLVILSSCGTTQARSRRDDGASGLSEAFLDAGAGAVISSLWEADDEGTAAMMGELHRALQAGASGDEALRRAQLWALRSGAAQGAPRVWGAFRYER